MRLDALLAEFSQDYPSGGMHTAPETRMLLCSLAYSARAKRILETGYDAGITTWALALTGAQVQTIDDLSEYPEAESVAVKLLAEYPNVELLRGDAVKFLQSAEDESFDFIFVDDNHNSDHVTREAVEIKRVLTPGGYAAFHDVNLYNLWNVIKAGFEDWECIKLPAFSPHGNLDYGLGLVRKPKKKEGGQNE